MDASIHMHIQKTPKSSISNLTGERCVIEDAFTVPFVSDEINTPIFVGLVLHLTMNAML